MILNQANRRSSIIQFETFILYRSHLWNHLKWITTFLFHIKHVSDFQKNLKHDFVNKMHPRSRKSKKNIQYNAQSKNDKQRRSMHHTENYRLSNTNHTRMLSDTCKMPRQTTRKSYYFYYLCKFPICDKVCQWLATGRWFSPPIKLTAKI